LSSFVFQVNQGQGNGASALVLSLLPRFSVFLHLWRPFLVSAPLTRLKLGNTSVLYIFSPQRGFSCFIEEGTPSQILPFVLADSGSGNLARYSLYNRCHIPLPFPQDLLSLIRATILSCFSIRTFPSIRVPCPFCSLFLTMRGFPLSGHF